MNKKSNDLLIKYPHLEKLPHGEDILLSIDWEKLPKHLNKKTGYVEIKIQFKFSVYKSTEHRLVARKYIPNPENKPFINHKNGIKSDNRIENLEWCTPKENTQHSMNILGNTSSPILASNGLQILIFSSISNLKRMLCKNHNHDAIDVVIRRNKHWIITPLIKNDRKFNENWIPNTEFLEKNKPKVFVRAYITNGLQHLFFNNNKEATKHFGKKSDNIKYLINTKNFKDYWTKMDSKGISNGL